MDMNATTMETTDNELETTEMTYKNLDKHK